MAFGVDSAEVAAYGAVGAYYPVAGDDDRQLDGGHKGWLLIHSQVDRKPWSRGT